MEAREKIVEEKLALGKIENIKNKLKMITYYQFKPWKNPYFPNMSWQLL
jgi:hypothetical protein